MKPEGAGLNTLREIERILDDLQSETNRVRNSISFRIRSREQIDANLRNSISRLQRECTDAQQLALSMSRIMGKYRTAEQKTVENYQGNTAQGNVGSSTLDIPNYRPRKPEAGSEQLPNGGADGAQDTSKPDWMGSSGAVVSGEAGVEGVLGGIDASASADGSVLGYNTKLVGSADWDLDKGKVGAGIRGEAQGYLAKGEVEGQLGWLGASAAATVGSIMTSGEAGAYLFRDGKFDPSLRLAGKAKAEGLKGEVETQIGNEDYNIHAKGTGTIGYASAESECAVGKDGISASAKVGAAVVHGEVKSGFTLFGVNVDLSASGSLMSVGAGAEFNASANSFELGGNLAFLAGLGLKIKVSW